MNDLHAHGEKTRRDGSQSGRGERESSGGYGSNRFRQNNPPTAGGKSSPGNEESHYKFLESFKTLKCKQSGAHDRRLCKYWHSKLDRRRNPFVYSYSTMDCPHQSESSDCNDRDECKFSHNTIEKMYHPNIFKMNMCQKVLSGGICDRGTLCAFAHSTEDQRHSTTPQAPQELVNASILEKLVYLIQQAGEEGVLGSDLPKRFQATFNKPFDEATDSGRTKIKDILADHDHIQVFMHKGAQPRFVYSLHPLDKKSPSTDRLAENPHSTHNTHTATPTTTTTTTTPPTNAANPMTALNGEQTSPSLPEIQARLVEIIKACGAAGVLGSDLPKKYLDLHRHKVEVLDDSGVKVRLKDILVSHPDIRYEMYKQLQPRFFFSEGCNKNYQPPSTTTTTTATTTTATTLVAKPEAEAVPTEAVGRTVSQPPPGPHVSTPAVSSTATATGTATGTATATATATGTASSSITSAGHTNYATTQLRSVLLGGAPGLSLPTSAAFHSAGENSTARETAAAHPAVGLSSRSKGPTTRSPAHASLSVPSAVHTGLSSSAPVAVPPPTQAPTKLAYSSAPASLPAPTAPTAAMRTDLRSFAPPPFAEEAAAAGTAGTAGTAAGTAAGGAGHESSVPDAMTRVLLERVHELNQIYLYLHLVESSLARVVNREEPHLEASRHLWTIKLAIKERLDQLGFRSNTLATPLTLSAMGSAAAVSALTVPARPAAVVATVVPPVTVATPIKPVCAMPDCSLEGIYVCTGCRHTYYCGVAHQRQHWAQQHCGECNRRMDG